MSLEGEKTLHTYIAAVRDYPHTTPLKAGERRIENCALEFPHINPIYKAFPQMVSELKYDVCEMAIATFLQAHDVGKKISLLPVVMNGDFHHHSLSQRPGGSLHGPRDLVGKRVGVRAYGQTTGMWVRGVLKEDYGVEADQVTWVTTEDPHVKESVLPANVERAASGTVKELLRDGDIAAAVLGPVVMDDGGALVPVIEDWQAAEQAWFERHSAVPMNHMLTVRTDLLKEDPDAVRGIYEAFTGAIDATKGDGPQTSRQRAVTHGLNDSLLSALEVGVRYAFEQKLISREVPVEELFADFTTYLDA